MNTIAAPSRRRNAASKTSAGTRACAVLVSLVMTMTCRHCLAEFPKDIPAGEFDSLAYSAAYGGFVPPSFPSRPESVRDFSQPYPHPRSFHDAFPFTKRKSNDSQCPNVLIPHRYGALSLFIGDESFVELAQTDLHFGSWEINATGCALTPDGTGFATFGDNGIIRVYSGADDPDFSIFKRPLTIQEGWLVDTSEAFLTPKLPKNPPEPIDPKQLHARVPIKGVTFSRDGKLLFGLMVDGSVHLWSAVTGEYMRQVRAGSAIRKVLDIEPAKWRSGPALTWYFRSSPDNKSMICPVRLEQWRLKDFEPNDTEIEELHLSTDEKSLAFTWRRHSTIVVDVDSGKALPHPAYGRVFAADRVNNEWYSIQSWYNEDQGYHFAIDCIDARTGKVLAKEMLRHQHFSNKVMAGGTVARLAVHAAMHKGGDRYIHIYDFKDREVIERRVFENPTDADTGMYGISPDGRWLIIGRGNESLQSIDLENGAITDVIKKRKR